MKAIFTRVPGYQKKILPEHPQVLSGSRRASALSVRRTEEDSKLSSAAQY